MTKKNNTLLRSFARRIGKGLSNEQQELLANILPIHIIDKDNPLANAPDGKKVFLEIGCGMGENIINHAASDPHSVYIGCEPYLNGIANCLKMTQQQELSNILLWPDDVDMVLPNIAENTLAGITILFPDPWHKRRHNKRRIMNETRIKMLYNILEVGGSLWFGTDISDYFQQVAELLQNFGKFELVTINAQPPHYVMTKYNQKALKEGREAQFLQAIKKAAK